MKEIIERRRELFAENQSILRKSFMLERSLTTAVVAAAFAEKNKTADVDLIKESKKLLKEKQGVFSDFRSYSELIVSARMALSENPEKYIDELIEVYDQFQKGKVFGSSYRVLAAMSIYDQGKKSEAGRLVEKANAILSGMKKAHRFLTSDEDTVFAALLAMTDKNVEDILAELEESYRILKKHFTFHDNAVYSLAQVLTAYEGSAGEKCGKVMDLFDAFKAAGAKYGKGYELASLGALAGIGADKDELVSEVIGVADYIKGKKGFGMLDMDKQSRLMLGTLLVSGAYMAADNGANESAIGGEIGRIVAVQTAIFVTMMVIMTTTAAASTSH